MKAAQLIQYGGQEAIKLNDVEKPEPGPGQVLVEAFAAAANPFDWHVRDGDHKKYIKLSFPAILGGDVSGKVAEIGQGVSGFKVGQPVYGMANAAGGQGSFAEFTPVNANQLAAKPEKLDYVGAAALPLVAVSAYQALVDTMSLQTNQKVLIHGGAGGIGYIAIQLAKYLGAYVATTVTADNNGFVKDLGADKTIDYKQQDFSEMLKGYDAVFDTVGGATNAKSYQILRPRGVLVSMVEQPNEDLVKKFNVSYVHQSSKPTVKRLAKIAELVDSGVLKVKIDKIFPLDQAAEALEYLKTGHPHGKVVIRVR